MKILAACVLLTLIVCSSAAFALNPDDDAVAAITKIETDAVKADLSGDSGFYEKLLADGWTGGTSRGTYDTKDSFLADMKDTKNKRAARR